MDYETLPIPLEDLARAYDTLGKVQMNHEPDTPGWKTLTAARECVAVEVCEQYGYDAMVALTG